MTTAVAIGISPVIYEDDTTGSPTPPTTQYILQFVNGNCLQITDGNYLEIVTP